MPVTDEKTESKSARRVGCSDRCEEEIDEGENENQLIVQLRPVEISSGSHQEYLPRYLRYVSDSRSSHNPRPSLD